MRIAPRLLAQVVAHAVRDAPNECCGIVATRNGAAHAVHALENLAASPARFEVDGEQLQRLLAELEEDGATLGAVYHSHTSTAPYPSLADVHFAAGWPDVEWLIVGTASPQPEVRSYLIGYSGQITDTPQIP